MNRRQRISVIVRAYNEESHLGRLLDGLSSQRVVPDEIIVVDSGSTDRTVELAEARGCRVVHIPKELFSFGRSLNYGCAAATGDILMIVSAHVYPVYDDYVGNMLEAFENHNVSIAYGRQVGDERTKFSESRIMLQWFPTESIWDQGHPFSNNANAAVTRETWALHKYDESLPGLEDLDFARRVIAAGDRICYLAEAPVVHVHEETWEIIRNRYRREAIGYQQIMGAHGMSAMSAVWLAIANIVGDYWHAARMRRLWGNLRNIPRFRHAQFFGAWEGFRLRGRVDDNLLKRFYYPPESNRGGQRRSQGERIDYATIEKRN